MGPLTYRWFLQLVVWINGRLREAPTWPVWAQLQCILLYWQISLIGGSVVTVLGLAFSCRWQSLKARLLQSLGSDVVELGRALHATPQAWLLDLFIHRYNSPAAPPPAAAPHQLDYAARSHPSPLVAAAVAVAVGAGEAPAGFSPLPVNAASESAEGPEATASSSTAPADRTCTPMPRRDLAALAAAVSGASTAELPTSSLNTSPPALSLAVPAGSVGDGYGAGEDAEAAEPVGGRPSRAEEAEVEMPPPPNEAEVVEREEEGERALGVAEMLGRARSGELQLGELLRVLLPALPTGEDGAANSFADLMGDDGIGERLTKRGLSMPAFGRHLSALREDGTDVCKRVALQLLSCLGGVFDVYSNPALRSRVLPIQHIGPTLREADDGSLKAVPPEAAVVTQQNKPACGWGVGSGDTSAECPSEEHRFSRTTGPHQGLRHLQPQVELNQLCHHKMCSLFAEDSDYSPELIRCVAAMAFVGDMYYRPEEEAQAMYGATQFHGPHARAWANRRISAVNSERASSQITDALAWSVSPAQTVKVGATPATRRTVEVNWTQIGEWSFKVGAWHRQDYPVQGISETDARALYRKAQEEELRSVLVRQHSIWTALRLWASCDSRVTLFQLDCSIGVTPRSLAHAEAFHYLLSKEAWANPLFFADLHSPLERPPLLAAWLADGAATETAFPFSRPCVVGTHIVATPWTGQDDGTGLSVMASSGRRRRGTGSGALLGVVVIHVVAVPGDGRMLVNTSYKWGGRRGDDGAFGRMLQFACPGGMRLHEVARHVAAHEGLVDWGGAPTVPAHELLPRRSVQECFPAELLHERAVAGECLPAPSLGPVPASEWHQWQCLIAPLVASREESSGSEAGGRAAGGSRGSRTRQEGQKRDRPPSSPSPLPRRSQRLQPGAAGH